MADRQNNILPRNTIKRYLNFITWEGAFANVFIIFTGGAFATGLALMLGAGDFEIGLLAAIPFLSQVFQLLSTYISGFFSSRKSAVFFLSGLGRQIWWLIPLFLMTQIGGQLEMFLIIVFLSNICVMIATPIWIDWMADLVPENIRARYFGVRSAVLALVNVVAVLLGGFILDLARAQKHENIGFAVIIAISCLSAAIALMILNRIPDPAPRGLRARFSLIRLKEPLKNRSFRRLLMIFFGWNISVGFSAPFFAPHMLTNLQMSFTLVSVYSAVFSIAAILLNKPWGAVIDRFGSRPVMTSCAFGIGIVPFIWLFPRYDFRWILVFEAIYSGALWTGFNLAAFNIPISNSPKKERTDYLAMFSVITGLGFFIASLLGGIFAEVIHDCRFEIAGLSIINYHIIFVISGMLRLFTAGLSLTFHEPKEKSIPIMMQFMGDKILKKLSTGWQFIHFPEKRKDDK
jgi:MFS family permease